MNFDLGEVLTQAWQVSWKNKRLVGSYGRSLIPLLTIIQGFALTYLKPAAMFVYLRHTRSPGMQEPVLQEVPA